MEVKLEVSIERQQLLLYKAGVLLTKYAVSTSRYGIGNQQGSFKTPLGRHQIISKVGEHAPAYTHFSARVPTQMQWSSATDSYQKDWILARVLCLSGMEPDENPDDDDGNKASGTKPKKSSIEQKPENKPSPPASTSGNLPQKQKAPDLDGLDL